jgi:hypothetical protein
MSSMATPIAASSAASFPPRVVMERHQVLDAGQAGKDQRVVHRAVSPADVPGVLQAGVLRVVQGEVDPLGRGRRSTRLLDHQGFAAATSGTSVFAQVPSGLNFRMASPVARVPGPRSFSYTTPS